MKLIVREIALLKKDGETWWGRGDNYGEGTREAEIHEQPSQESRRARGETGFVSSRQWEQPEQGGDVMRLFQHSGSMVLIF